MSKIRKWVEQPVGRWVGQSKRVDQPVAKYMIPCPRLAKECYSRGVALHTTKLRLFKSNTKQSLRQCICTKDSKTWSATRHSKRDAFAFVAWQDMQHLPINSNSP
eukprot:4923302-Amphidinium_carterae.2